MKGTPMSDTELRRVDNTLRRDPVGTWTAQSVADLLATVAQARNGRAVPCTSKGMLTTRIELLGHVRRRIDGFGEVLDWSESARVTYTRILKGIGLTVVSETAAKKRGLQLKRGAQVVARGYFGAPLQRRADLYIAELQCRPIKPGK